MTTKKYSGGNHINTKTVEGIRVLIVDDHKVARAGMRALLDTDHDIKVVGEAITGQSAVAECSRYSPDVVLLDIRLPDTDGLKVCRLIKRAQPLTKVLVLTSVMDDQTVLAAIAAEADGYLLKADPNTDLAQAIRTVAAGGTILDPDTARRLVNNVKGSLAQESRHTKLLRPNEEAILRKVAVGMTNKEIASDMGLTEGTVRNRLVVIFEKIGVGRRAEAVNWYVRQTHDIA